MTREEEGLAPHPYRTHTGKKSRKTRHGSAPPTDRAARQHSRYSSLKAQFNKCARQLIGRTAIMVLPGQGCQHSVEQFRPVHWERRWRTRPFFVLLSVGKEEQRFTLKLAGATSYFDDKSKKLRYVNGNGQKPCSYDYLLPPVRGARSPVLDGASNHVLFTAGNNLLQELVNTANQPTTPLALPKLVCLIPGRHVPIDFKKVDKLAAGIPPALREQYKQRLVKEAEIMSLGTRFGNASVMPDAAIVSALTEKRAYEDYSDMLGAETANPTRKILMAANPASAVLAQNGLEEGWDTEADQDLYEKLLAEMRAMLPLPELVSDSDLLDALAEPNKPVRPSRALTDLIAQEPESVVRALRNTMPYGAALREHVTDRELLDAAANPYAPLTVGAYSKIQVVDTEALGTLPEFTAGDFWSTDGWVPPSHPQFPVWSAGDGPEGLELEEGDVKTDGVVDCIQLKRDLIAADE